MNLRRLLPILLVVAIGCLLLPSPLIQAQTGNGQTVRSFISAINSGQTATVQAALASDFKLTLADGTMESGASAVQALLALPRPITVVSLAPQGRHALSGMLRFGSSAPVSVTFTGEGSGQIGSMTIAAASAATPSPAAGPTAATMNQVQVGSGWNLVAGPAGTVVTGASGSLYTFPAGASAYDAVPVTAPLKAGAGYWAYFTAPATLTLAAGGSQPLTDQLPAGQWVMVGDPFTARASVAGADVVYTYSAAGGYQAVMTLSAGQGAWAYSAAGGTLTLTPAQ